MSRRHLALFGLIVALALMLWATLAALSGNSSSRLVTVGLYQNPPKVYSDQNGKPSGLFVELLDAVARAEGWRLRYVACPWSDCLEQLAQGKLDLMPDVAFSSERNQRFDFNRVSVAGSWSQVFADPGQKITTLDDLAGKRVAILEGGIQQAFLTQLMAGGHHAFRPVAIRSLEQGYAAVVAGDADAVVSNSFFAARNAGKYKLQETPIVFQPANLYFASAKGSNAELLAAIDEHLLAWRRTPDSLYFDALHRAMAEAPEVVVPRWISWSLAALGAALLSSLAISMLLRWRVAQSTRALVRSTKELEHQRASLEQRVVERTAELQALFDSAGVGIVLMRDRVIVRCNQRMAEMAGYPGGELIGQPTRIFYPDDESWAAVGRDDAVVWRGETYIRAIEWRRRDGSRYWVRISARAVDPGDRAKGTVAVVEDITAERRALDELLRAKTIAEEATHAKSEFLANMSHEIRTPMNAILGMLYLALRSGPAPKVRDYLAKAQGAAHSLLGIINDVLDISKIEARKLEIDSVEFGLDAVVERLSDTVGEHCERQGIRFLVRHDAAIPPLLVGDPLRLGQVLLNLCGNAVKFTERGEVELGFRGLAIGETDLTLQVCVRDSGIGMGPETVRRLFEKFTQADQSTTRRFGGTGLGLAISKQLVELMGGRIWVEDSAPGKGTTLCFTVKLGIARQDGRARELLDQAGPLLEGRRVLVVDDNEVAREITAQTLRHFRLDVGTAADGAAALAALEQAGEQPFDLVLMDWRMPGMNGDEVTQRIHGDPAISQRPKVVMVTAYGREDVIRRAEQAGVDGFLIKPVSPSTLLDAILSALGRGRIPIPIPLRQGESPEIASARAVRGQLAGARVLLVEDNDINREFAGELLRGEGIATDEAANGQEAVDRVRRGAYDAVLMDIQMPVMDGLEATRRIRALGGAAAQLPIIAMSALAMTQDAEKSRAAGMNDHLSKPIDPDRLLALLARWLPPAARQDGVPLASPLASPLPPTALPAELLAMKSLDTRQGIRRIGGRVDAYRRQLLRFRARYADAADELRRLASEQGLAQAQEYCHALKGVCGNLGALAVYAKVGEIDGELRQGQPLDAGALDALRVALREAIDEINAIDALSTAAAPARPVATQPLAGPELRALLERLRESLDNDLGRAEALLGQLRDGLAGSPWAAPVEAIAASVDVFDIDAARTRLASVLDELELSPSPSPSPAPAE